MNFSLLYGFCGFDLLKDGWDRFDKSFTRYKVTYVKAKSGMIYRVVRMLKMLAIMSIGNTTYDVAVGLNIFVVFFAIMTS